MQRNTYVIRLHNIGSAHWARGELDGALEYLERGLRICERLAPDSLDVATVLNTECRPEIGLDSYDRFFPSQDTMPQDGLGNLITLPLQCKPRQQGNSVFVDDELVPYEDQLAFLSSLRPMSLEALTGWLSKHNGLDRYSACEWP